MAEKKRRQSASEERAPRFELVPTSRIIERKDWNVRKERTSPESPEERALLDKTFEHDAGEWPDDQLDASILAQGLIQPITLGHRIDPLLPPEGVDLSAFSEEEVRAGLYPVLAGHRRLGSWKRVRPAEPIPAMIRPSLGDPASDEISHLMVNLVENIQRSQLRPWEVADRLHTLVKVRGVDRKLVASETGLSLHYVNNLVRIRAKLCPELWDLFCQGGEGLIASARVNDLSAACKLPHGEQVAAYQAMREERQGGRPPGRTAREPVEGASDWAARAQEEQSGAMRGWSEAAGQLLADEYAKGRQQNANAAWLLTGVAWAFGVAAGEVDADADPGAAIKSVLKRELRANR